ncbi:MAG: hypothetical protein P1U89_07050 [Verrucomicrobiales bacterium]|nr:hypothetical protein [Verrucomicrobiales bacterium]
MEPKPCFTVGIVGHINLPEGADVILKERVREVLQWLRDEKVTNCKEFGKPLGFQNTPVVLLSPLAPGADHLAAEVALDLGIEVRSPMPFPPAIYRESTTFTSKPELTGERQKAFDELLDRVGRENAFAVRHYDDEKPLTEDSDWDIDDETFRNLRYRATGEFVAAHCDLLIAICNQESRADLPDKDSNLTSRSLPGTRVITASYINGLRPGILPIPPSLSWQDNGPLVRIFTPNARTDRDPRVRPIGEIEIWHPEETIQHGDNSKKIHKRRMQELRDLAKNLETLNRDLDTVKVDEEEVKAVVPSSGDCPSCQRILDLFRFDRAIELLADKNNKYATILTKLSYLAGFLAFICLALTEGGKYIYLLVALGLFLGGAIARSLIKNVFSFFRKREDYRAIAEGIRVQGYWSSVGIRQSVASNYLQRLRGDIDWIRSSIDSLIFPCDRFADAFDALGDHGKKHQRFLEVLKLWVSGQEHYFAKGTYRKTRTREVLSFLSYVCLTAGGMMVVIDAFLEAGFLAEYHQTMRFLLAEAGIKIWAGWTALALVFAALFSISETRFALSFREETNVKKLSYDLKVFNFFKHWGFRLGTGVVLGFLVYSMIYVSGFSDAIVKLSKAIFLALGGLWMSYANTVFAKEDSKRYADMRGQFSAAKRKLQYVLDEYLYMIKTGVSPEELEKMQKGIQDLYLALGREALHEQTEWLLTRRSRPVEPVAKVR